MRNTALFFIMLFSSIYVQAQTWSGSTPGNIFYNLGNIGIGTTDPQAKLQITQTTPDIDGLIIQTNTINGDALQHYGAITFKDEYYNKTGNYSQIRNYSNLYSTWGSQLSFHVTKAGVVNTLIEAMRINNVGNVGIGTTNPEARLTVKGKILASEIQIRDVGTIPDYVFKPGYQLMTLNDVEDFVKQHQHLPEVPSEKEFKENGMNMAEMNTIFLKKIEELSLYVINLNKEITALKIESDEMKSILNLANAQPNENEQSKN